VLQQLGGQVIARLDSTAEAGVYRLQANGEGGTTELTFVVQAGRGDSTVAKADAEILRAWWGKIPFEVVHPDPSVRPEQAVGADAFCSGHGCWSRCLAVAGEMYFVHRLCPVMNPAVVSRPWHGTVFSHPCPKAEEVAA